MKRGSTAPEEVQENDVALRLVDRVVYAYTAYTKAALAAQQTPQGPGTFSLAITLQPVPPAMLLTMSTM